MNILVGENWEKDKEIEKAVKKVGGKYYVFPKNSGNSYVRNRLLEKVKTKYVFVGDDDFFFTKPAKVDKMVKFLDENDEFDAIGGVHKTNKITRYHNFLIERDRNMVKFIKNPRPYEKDKKSGLRYCEADSIANFFVGRTDRLVQWNEKLISSYEHPLFFIDMKEAGRKMAFTPDCVVWHKKQGDLNPPEYKKNRWQRQDLANFLEILGVKEYLREDEVLTRKTANVVVPRQILNRVPSKLEMRKRIFGSQINQTKKSKILFICGPSCSGKTTLAKKLANKYGVPHIELDRVIAQSPAKQWIEYYIKDESYFSTVSPDEHWNNIIAQSEKYWNTLRVEIRKLNGPAIIEATQLLPRYIKELKEVMDIDGVCLLPGSLSETVRRNKLKFRNGMSDKSEELKEQEANLIYNVEMPRYRGEAKRNEVEFFTDSDLAEKALERKMTVKPKLLIPKKIHIIWIGPKEPPMKWINSWKVFHPDWEFTLWDNDKVFGRKWKNQKHIDYYLNNPIEGKTRYEGVADLLKYEILYEEGGITPDADMECVANTEELYEGYDLFGIYENEIKRPGFVQPLYGANKGSLFAKQLIDTLHAKDVLGVPWKYTGNRFMKEMIEKHQPNIKIFPSHYFIPEHFTGEAYKGKDKIYARHYFASTSLSKHEYKDGK